MKSLSLLLLASVGLSVLAGAALAVDIPEACNSYKPAVTGGPMPSPESDTVVIRWLGNANFEFAYKGKVYLFDAYFDRGPIGLASARRMCPKPKRSSCRTRISIIFRTLAQSPDRPARPLSARQLRRKPQ
jgi:hypothetical protein